MSRESEGSLFRGEEDEKEALPSAGTLRFRRPEIRIHDPEGKVSQGIRGEKGKIVIMPRSKLVPRGHS